MSQLCKKNSHDTRALRAATILGLMAEFPDFERVCQVIDGVRVEDADILHLRQHRERYSFDLLIREYHNTTAIECIMWKVVDGRFWHLGDESAEFADPEYFPKLFAFVRRMQHR